MTSSPLSRITTEPLFYNQDNYHVKTAKDFSQKTPLPPSYRYETTKKASRIAALVFSIILFPIGLCRLIHRLIGKVFIVSSTPLLAKLVVDGSLKAPQEMRQRINIDQDFGYKRISVDCNGTLIDVMLLIGRDTPKRRWVLYSGGTGESYEQTLTQNHSLRHLIKGLQANAVLFNYPGVGSSSGLPNSNGMVESYNAVLSMLEDKMRGLGAKEIIGFAHSFIGGGVQGEALKTHALHGDIKYVFVKDRTCASVSRLAYPPFNALLHLSGWNFDSTKSSSRLLAPEIIIQAANVGAPQVITRAQQLKHDGIIHPKASLAAFFFEKDRRHDKTIFGIPEDHDDPFSNPQFLTDKIDELLPLL